VAVEGAPPSAEEGSVNAPLEWWPDELVEDIARALRMYDRHQRSRGKTLSASARAMSNDLERAVAVSSGQLRAAAAARVDDHEDDDLLSYGEAAQRLNVSVSTLRRMVRANEITPTRIGRRVLFPPASIAQYIADRTNPPPGAPR
jgi:excisionase family DNA binding protein